MTETPLSDRIRQAARYAEILDALEALESPATAAEIEPHVETSVSSVRRDLNRLKANDLVRLVSRREPYRWETTDETPAEATTEEVFARV